MAVTVNINGLSCVHQTSGGMATATLPDVCRTPYAGTPIPYPNVALSSDLAGGTVTVTVDGSSAAIQSSMFAKSTGDEAGALGGVVSQVFMMEATFLSFSPTVLFEGQPACRLTDKMLMNKGNTVCMDGVVNPLVVAPDSAPPDAVLQTDPGEPVFCHVDSLLLFCGHSPRPSLELVNSAITTYQVISTRAKPDRLIIRLIGTCGGNASSASANASGDTAPKTCPSLLVAQQPHGKWASVPVPDGELVLPPPKALDRMNIGVALLKMFGGSLPHDTYIVRPVICNTHPRADVAVGVWAHIEVFHEASISGEISLGYAHPKIKAPDPDKKDGEDVTPFPYERQATWTLGGKLEGKFGGREMPKLEKSSDMKGSDPLPLFGTLLDSIGKFTKIFDSMKTFGTGVKGDILFPKWKFAAAGVELAELPNSTLVGPKGTFKAELAPLIGLQLTVSLMEYLILFAGSLCGPPGVALARFLNYVRKNLSPKTNPNASLDLEIELITKGEIGGGLALTFIENGGLLEGKVSGKISIQLEGRVIGRGKVGRVEAGAGAKLGLAAATGEGSKPSEVEARVIARAAKGRLKPDGEIEFTGLAVYYVLFLEFGVGGAATEKGADTKSKESSMPGATAGDAAKKAKPGKGTTLFKEEIKDSCVLIQPWKWLYSTPSIEPLDPDPPVVEGSGGAEGSPGYLEVAPSPNGGSGGSGGAGG